MRVVVAEDHPLYRAMLEHVCARAVGCSVVGATDSAARAVGLCRVLKPDLLLLDLELADGDGFEVLDALTLSHCRPKTLVLSAHCDEYALLRAERAGVIGFLEKATTSEDDVVQALEAIRVGRRCPHDALEAARASRRRDPLAVSKLFTDRQEEVFRCLCLGMTDLEVSESLGISIRTAHHHRTDVMRKLGFRSSLKLVVFGIERGFARFLHIIPSGRNVLSRRPIRLRSSRINSFGEGPPSRLAGSHQNLPDPGDVVRTGG